MNCSGCLDARVFGHVPPCPLACPGRAGQAELKIQKVNMYYPWHPIPAIDGSDR